MHTPDEAKGLWCPFVRVGVMSELEGLFTPLNLPAYNRLLHARGEPKDAVGTIRLEYCNCLADGCSAWRWAETFSVTDRHDAEIAEKFMGKGFCGLAGRP